MSIRYHQDGNREIKTSKEFANLAKTGPAGNWFAFEELMVGIDYPWPHSAGLMGIKDSATGQRSVYIEGETEFPAVPTGVECFPFGKSFVYVQGRKLFQVDRLSTTQGIHWKARRIYTHSCQIINGAPCENGDLFVIGEDGSIVRIVAKKSRIRRALLVVPHKVAKIPRHEWDDYKVVGNDIWTRKDTTFFRNGIQIPTHAPGNRPWDLEDKWFAALQFNRATVVIAHQEMTRIKADNWPSDNTGKTIIYFRSIVDGEILFHEFGDNWHFYQTGTAKIVAYNSLTKEIKEVGGGTILASIPGGLSIDRIHQHFFGVLVEWQKHYALLPVP